MEIKIKGLLVASLLVCTSSFGTLAADLLKANDLFKNKLYQQALDEYKQGAKLGSPHAYYYLGIMYAKGLGVTKDPANALIYFNLAASTKYQDSEALLQKILKKLPPQQLSEVELLLADSAKKQLTLTGAYLPKIKLANLGKKITFDGSPELEKKVYMEDLELELDFDLGFDASDFSQDELSEESDHNMIMKAKNPLLIIDHDVAPDGTVRYVNEIQKIGSVNRIIDSYKLFPLPKPQFDGQAAEFIHRGYLAAAVYDKFQLSEERPRLYRELILLAKKGRNSRELADKYQYAVAMINFPWLEKEPGQANQLLLELAKQGHPLAMYEYGLKLYREQDKIPEAIHWISEASKYGLARAEYRLGRFLQTSPWLEHDDTKALFWYESAMEKNHEPSTIRAAEIRLLSKNSEIRNVNTAIDYLARVKESQSKNPEYYYLLAMSYKYRETRDMKLVVENLREAISMADRANWDVTEWENLLAKLTTGRVYVTDDYN